MQTITTAAGIAAYGIITVVTLEAAKHAFTDESRSRRVYCAVIALIAAFAWWGLWINTTFGG